MPDHRTSLFKRFEILKNLPADALDDLSAALSWTSAPAGKQIVLANEPSGDVYFIVNGRVRVLLSFLKVAHSTTRATCGLLPSAAVGFPICSPTASWYR